MLKHWRDMKAQHPQSILFYRVGDFYEMFHEDATLAARVLDITLTSRGDGVPLAGVPVKAAAEYLRLLVAAGHRVAICEQVEDPRLAKGLVRREVVETVTPGALRALSACCKHVASNPARMEFVPMTVMGLPLSPGAEMKPVASPVAWI